MFNMVAFRFNSVLPIHKHSFNMTCYLPKIMKYDLKVACRVNKFNSVYPSPCFYFII